METKWNKNNGKCLHQCFVIIEEQECPLVLLEKTKIYRINLKIQFYLNVILESSFIQIIILMKDVKK